MLSHSFVLISLCIVFVTCLEHPIIETSNGKVRGNTNNITDGRIYHEFLGIPYAASTEREFRFKKPRPVESWSGIRNATKFGPHCHQLVALFYPVLGMDDDVSEDCLSLNIWVPGELDSGRKLPVMFYYFGGAFILGTGAMYPGQDLAVHGDVIVVTFNYRISALGFLSTAHSSAKGNWALWDSKMALEWVKQNIGKFGGDEEQITIFGESAGAVMTSHSATSPQTSSLVKRAIAHSGSANGYFGVVKREHIKKGTLDLASFFFCDDEDDLQHTVDCLREEEPEDIDLFAILSPVIFAGTLPIWLPTVDEEFLPLPPKEMWQQGYGKNVSFMTGKLKDDAGGLIILNPLGLFYEDALSFAGDKESLEFLLSLITAAYKPIDDEVVFSIKDRYPNLKSDDFIERSRAAVDMGTDWFFGSGSFLDAVYHSDKSDKGTYNYELQHKMTFLDYPKYINGSHVDDCYPLFGEPFLETLRKELKCGEEWKDGDIKFRDNLRAYWYNFVKTGNPNNGPHPIPIGWPTFNNRTFAKIRITQDMGASSIETESSEKRNLYKFFNNDLYIDPLQTAKSFSTKSYRRSSEVEKKLDAAISNLKNIGSRMLRNAPEQREKLYKIIENALNRREAKRIKMNNKAKDQDMKRRKLS
ncbi:DgyrCDS7076 [Dimorphilus gyrociliatus]|uniref:Carboxylic ester hydrolase n=1 Tax=Dimorphilus gyrociliatus TaxID=2664684 RepID=A0A7I8VQ51_9ANNE|nr:DgyrCDS7076 [Dimorphilus gyrociliatus]